MKRTAIILTAMFLLYGGLNGQISAKLTRYADVSESHITFVYGGDIWLMPRTGGVAFQVTHSPGEESWPRFSPDGRFIAYTASYNGNRDIFVIPVTGGVPARVTYHSFGDRMVDWHPDGKHILFASPRESGNFRVNQFYLVSREGGLPEKLRVPYGELASFSPDGNRLAYVTKITENYPFKRYRGGLASDVILYDLQNNSAENITANHAIDGKPAWVEGAIYYLSDQGENMRLNIWRYDTADGTSRQVTRFSDFDIAYMAAGTKDLVFEAGGNLYLMDIATHRYDTLDVRVVSDLSPEMPRREKVSKSITRMTLSPKGKRVVFEARGELFNVPAREGYVINMTRSSGAFDQQPSWSPDGETVAFWSDRSGEYQIYLQDAGGRGEPRPLTRRSRGFGYRLFWSPDSGKLAFIDETNTVSIIDVETGRITEAGNTRWNVGHNARYRYRISWSPDSRWLAFTVGLDNANNAIFIYDVASRRLRQATSGFFEDFHPAFSVDGRYLFYLTNRQLSAAYSDMNDGTWIYPNATRIAAVSLTGDAPSLLAPENDDLAQDSKAKAGKGGGDAEKTGDRKGPEVTIDFDQLESRLVLLPPKAGNIGGLFPLKDKLLYLRYPNTGSGERSASLVVYDFVKREEKTVIAGVERVVISSDRSALLVRSRGKYGIIKPAPDQKIKETVPVDGLTMRLVPRQEWRQIFSDIWRRHRDFFYDPNMHGVDWTALRERYGAMIEDARTRWDVTHICSDLAAELSAGHTYTFGGDVEEPSRLDSGFLGVDWAPGDRGFRIKRIVTPAAWDTEVRSPFQRPGVDVDAGDLILAVNGHQLETDKDPYAAFEGLSGKTVSLTLQRPGEGETRQVTVTCLTPGEERELRYLEWIEKNRRMVEKLSGGKLGYVYMSNTASRGQRELVQMYYGQLDKKGFIIDERFNGGGQLSDRFLELLKRPVVYNLHWRHGRDHTYPTKTNTGPMGMLINGWAGSGGDGLPWAFRELDARPIVGERTLGILVGPATGHRLIDGGGITVPGARLYYNDGSWFDEGVGVKPDIHVWDDPALLARGRDPQIERVVEEVLKLLEENPPVQTPAPPLEDRTAEGLKKDTHRQR